jgi:glycosyltransferase involved in cell wall biosynthesis
MSASNPPVVSIVLPVYNGARYLGESVQSCLDQTYPHWELIIVDDCSTDQTPEIIAGFLQKDARIRCIRHEQNKRLPAGLNSGFAEARGALLTWTSDDNRYLPHALEELVKQLTSNPTIDFIYSDYDEIDEAGQFLQTVHVKPATQLLQGNEGLACFLYRRRIYEQLGGYTADLFLAEDYDYWLRVLAAGFQMVPVHTHLYQYRRHAKSLTDAYRDATFLAAERALLRNLPKMTWASSTLRGQAYWHLAALARRRREYRLAFRYGLRGLRYAPTQGLGRVTSFLMRRLGGKRGALQTPAASQEP